MTECCVYDVIGSFVLLFKASKDRVCARLIKKKRTKKVSFRDFLTFLLVYKMVLKTLLVFILVPEVIFICWIV